MSEQQKKDIHKTYIYTAILSALLIIFDQITKHIAYTYVREQINILPFLSLQLTTNTGAAFGILRNNNLLFIAIGIIACAGIIYYMIRHIRHLARYDIVLLSLLLSGVLGNLIDRIFRGHVIDFLRIPHWPIFNFADTYITISVIFFVAYELWNAYKKND
jgi:signal peptidase II